MEVWEGVQGFEACKDLGLPPDHYILKDMKEILKV